MTDRVRSDRAYTRSSGLRLAFAGGFTTVLLVGLSAVGGMSYAASAVKHAAQHAGWVKIAASQSSPDSTAAEAQYVKKVTVCHKGKTISISKSALPAHLKQGDTVGKCPKAKGKPAKRGGVKGAKKGPRFTG
jgi:hypothetical protein